MRDKLFRKGVVVGIIFLFIGIVVTPDITAQNYRINNNSLETHAEELIECPIEIHGVEGLLKYTVMLTQKQIDELDVLFDNIKADLDNVETEEETISIFNNAMVSLYELGLLPVDMCVEEAQQLFGTSNVNAGELNLQDELYEEKQGNMFGVGYGENFDCSIVGCTINTEFWGNGKIAFGRESWVYGIGYYCRRAIGWIWTQGSNGVKKWLGSFYGQLGIIEEGYMHGGYVHWYHVGAVGFTGFKIKVGIAYILGYASHVALGPDLLCLQNSYQNSQSRQSINSLFLRFLEQFSIPRLLFLR